jgi:hypothetical protein
MFTFVTMASTAFTMRNVVTLQDYQDNSNEKVIKERTILHLKKKAIPVTKENQKMIKGMIEAAYKNQEITEDEKEEALAAFNSGEAILMEPIKQTEASNLEKLTAEEVEEMALENIDRRCENNAGKIIGWVGKGFRTAILGSHKLTTALSAVLSSAITAKGLNGLITLMIGKVVLRPAMPSLGIAAIEVCPGLYQLATAPATFFASCAISYGLLAVGGVLFVVAECAYEGDSFLKEEVLRIREEESCLHEKGLTLKQGVELKKLKKEWYLEWNQMRAQVFKTMLKNNPKKLKQALKNLDDPTVFLFDMKMPKLRQAIDKADKEIVVKIHEAETKFIEFCKQENQV